MTLHDSVAEDIRYLTETLHRPVDQLMLLRPSLESALFKLGHSAEEIEAGLQAYYNSQRTIH